MDGTILGQGFFTQGATAVAQTIIVPSNLDWLRVINFTQASGTAGNGYMFWWQRGMPNGQGVVQLSGGAHAVTANTTANNAFVLYDPSAQSVGSLNIGSTGVSGFTAANPAVVTVGSTTGLAAGNIIRFDTLNNQPQYAGIPFSVGYGTLTGTTFSVDYLNSTSSTPSTSGNWRIINYNALYYPRHRYILNISAAASAVITLSVDHGFTVGQEVRLSLPGGVALWGDFAALDGQQVIITATDTAVGNGHNTITVNVNTVGFLAPGAITFTARYAGLGSFGPFTQPLVVPLGEDTATSLLTTGVQTPLVNGVQIYGTQTGLLSDSTVNTGFLGMRLSAGAALPAGSASDVVFWLAGKSTFGGL